jgi:predicted nucleic acid-binding protein
MNTPVSGVADASVLINFLKLGRTELLAGFGLAVTTDVEAEITADYPAQVARFQHAVAHGHFNVIAADQPAELAIFGQLIAGGRLGRGECSAIAVALHRGCKLVIDDRRAIAEARRRQAGLAITGTGDILATLVRASVITVAEADQLLLELATFHRFRLPITSIADII